MLLIGRDGNLLSKSSYFSDGARMSASDSVALGVVVSPKFDLLVVSSADENVSVLADGQSVDL